MSQEISIRRCPGTPCGGCEVFFDRLRETPEGQLALYQRYEGTLTMNPFVPQPNDGGWTFCARNQSGEVIGLCHARPLPEHSVEAEYGILIDPIEQRKGVGSNLLRKTSEALREDGVEAVTASISLTNTPSIRLAQSAGAEIIYDREENLARVRIAL